MTPDRRPEAFLRLWRCFLAGNGTADSWLLVGKGQLRLEAGFIAYRYRVRLARSGVQVTATVRYSRTHLSAQVGVREEIRMKSMPRESRFAKSSSSEEGLMMIMVMDDGITDLKA